MTSDSERDSQIVCGKNHSGCLVEDIFRRPEWIVSMVGKHFLWVIPYSFFNTFCIVTQYIPHTHILEVRCEEIYPLFE